jgi:hypothetical protein
MAEVDPRQSGPPSLLPIPWRSPLWILGENLKKDLPAVLAQLRLSIQELWRRNAAGDLFTPIFWPTNLKPFFWPLLSFLFVLLIGLLLLNILQPTKQSRADSTLNIDALLNPEQIEASPKLSIENEKLPIQQLTPSLDLSTDPVIDKLLELLQPNAYSPLIASLQPYPDEGRLLIIPTTIFQKLSVSKMQEQADIWLEKSNSIGFSKLGLQTQDGVILGRSAQVGQGMILFIPLNP